MTELQVTINNLKDVLTSGNRLLFRLEKAQKDLEAPPHKWEHGDVFENNFGVTMVYIIRSRLEYVFCISGSCDSHHADLPFLLENGKFLFNIKEKL